MMKCNIMDAHGYNRKSFFCAASDRFDGVAKVASEIVCTCPKIRSKFPEFSLRNAVYNSSGCSNNTSEWQKNVIKITRNGCTCPKIRSKFPEFSLRNAVYNSSGCSNNTSEWQKNVIKITRNGCSLAGQTNPSTRASADWSGPRD